VYPGYGAVWIGTRAGPENIWPPPTPGRLVIWPHLKPVFYINLFFSQGHDWRNLLRGRVQIAGFFFKLYLCVSKVKVSRDRPRWPKGFRVD